MAGRCLRRCWLVVVAVGAVAVSVPPVAGAAFPGRNGRIAYEYERTVDDASPHVGAHVYSKIVSVRPNGRRRRTLLGRFSGGDSTFLKDPAYSRDGRKLAFADGPQDHQPPMDLLGPVRYDIQLSSSLYLARADGRRRRRLTGQRPGQFDRGPASAPDGRRLAFTRSPLDGWQIRVYRAGRSRTVGVFSQGLGLDLAWSLRGRLAFSWRDVIYTMRPDGSNRTSVVAGKNPDWSPHGRWIVYELPTPPSGSQVGGGIALIRPDGSRQHVLTTNGKDPAFSPDGRYIAFVRVHADPAYTYALAVMRLRGRKTRTIARVRPPGPAPTAPCCATEINALHSPTWQPLPRRRHQG